MSNLPFFDYEFNVLTDISDFVLELKLFRYIKTLQLLLTKAWKALIIAPSLEIGDVIVRIRN